MALMTKKERASKMRKRLKEIPGELSKDIETLILHREVLRGYVYHSKRRCGKPSCQCARGKLHDARVVATDIDGKRTTRSLSGKSGDRVASLAADYRRFRKAQRSFRRRCNEAADLIRKLEEIMSVEVFKPEKKRKRKKR